MFPNQSMNPSVGDAWTNSQGYYGSGYSGGGPSAGSAWYNSWQAGGGGRSSGGWAGYPPSSPSSAGEAMEGGHSGGVPGVQGTLGAATASTPAAYTPTKSQKLGINSNIYSLYQNRSHSVNITPDVTISSLTHNANNIHTNINNPNLPQLARMRDSGSGPPDQLRKDPRNFSSQSSESLFSSCMLEQTELKRVEGETTTGRVEGQVEGIKAARSDKDQDQLDAEQPELTIDEGAMEPDSSTDFEGSLGGGPSGQQAGQPGRSAGRLAEQEADQLGQHKQNKESHNSIRPRGPQEENEDDLEIEQERMFRHSKQFAQLFKVKSESQLYSSESFHKRRKLDPPSLVELSDILAENKRMVAVARQNTYNSLAASGGRPENGSTTGQNGLPLSVEIEELGTESDTVSPRTALKLAHNLLGPSGLSPRKRGRKPKHYSEILQELGQRGISITKTHRPGSPAAGGGPPPLQMLNQPSNHHDPANKQGGGGQPLQCPHCNKILTTSVGLMYHIRLHTGEKPYSCDLCGKSFATSSHYHYHIRTHSGEKPYRCDFCGKMYTASGSLRLHLKSHLSRLSANVFNMGMNMEGANMNMMDGINMFRGLEAMLGERGGAETGGHSTEKDDKMRIKQEPGLEDQDPEAGGPSSSTSSGPTSSIDRHQQLLPA